MNNMIYGPQIEGLGKLCLIYEQVDIASSFKELNKIGAEPASCRDYFTAVNRSPESQFGYPALTGFKTPLSSGWIREGYVTIPNGPTLLIASSPLLNCLDNLVKDFRLRREKAQRDKWPFRMGTKRYGRHQKLEEDYEIGPFYIEDVSTYMAIAKEDEILPPEKKRILILNESDFSGKKDSGGWISINPRDFSREDITRFLFRDVASISLQRFPQFNQALRVGITMQEDITNWEEKLKCKIRKPFAKQLYFDMNEFILKNAFSYEYLSKGFIGLKPEK
ncbi:hypothetical protein HYW75_03295 [Candidatus Pacearchaeota archaeon]|nr:hypothetical protein [Candidatus Pacearchaeota archaeon]